LQRNSAIQRLQAEAWAPRLRQDYAEAMIRLGVWYVRQLLATGRIAPRQVGDALTRRVNIYRLTSLWDGERDPADGFHDPEWDRVVDRVRPMFERFSLEQAAELEGCALAVIRPLLRPTIERVPGRVFGCWSYEVVGEHVADGPGLLGRLTNLRKIAVRLQRLAGIDVPARHASLHFFNAAAPRSPFEDPSRLAGDLRSLIQDCRQRHPTVQFLWCQSWLNSYSPFLALFPESWRQGASVRSPEHMDARSLGRGCLNTLNWWGQFMRSDGSFYEERGRRFRAEGGTFPYANRVCHDRVDSVDSFLAQIRN
jgi:hypothetical protein